jgi:hypothetical protein
MDDSDATAVTSQRASSAYDDPVILPSVVDEAQHRVWVGE